MHVALLGGTGDIGEGLALRLARDTDHDVVIGSREHEKAHAAATDYEATLEEHGIDASIGAAVNSEGAARGDIVILSVPAYHLADTIESVAASLEDSILVSPAVGMKRDDDGVHYNPPGIGSVTELTASTAPAAVPVVGAFHNLAAGRLSDLDATLGWDVPVVGDDEHATETVLGLVDDIEGLRGLNAGGLANASEVESITPLLINLAANNASLHDLGISFE